jgi:hypothetical protein
MQNDDVAPPRYQDHKVITLWSVQNESDNRPARRQVAADESLASGEGDRLPTATL